MTFSFYEGSSVRKVSQLKRSRADSQWSEFAVKSPLPDVNDFAQQEW